MNRYGCQFWRSPIYCTFKCTRTGQQMSPFAHPKCEGEQIPQLLLAASRTATNELYFVLGLITRGRTKLAWECQYKCVLLRATWILNWDEWFHLFGVSLSSYVWLWIQGWSRTRRKHEDEDAANDSTSLIVTWQPKGFHMWVEFGRECCSRPQFCSHEPVHSFVDTRRESNFFLLSSPDVPN